MRSSLVAAMVLLCTACSVPHAVHDLDAEAPPAELGRPGWVRGTARTGAWIGAIGGAVVSLATLPITYPISLVADEPLGHSKQEFLFAPVTGGASIGHFVLGAPADMLDFVFHRAWTDVPEQHGYEFVPMQPPVGGGEPVLRDPEQGGQPNGQ